MHSPNKDRSVIDIEPDLQDEDFTYWEELSIDRALNELSSSKNGLSTSETELRLKRDGPNELEAEPENPFFRFLSFLYVQRHRHCRHCCHHLRY